MHQGDHSLVRVVISKLSQKQLFWIKIQKIVAIHYLTPKSLKHMVNRRETKDHINPLTQVDKADH